MTTIMKSFALSIIDFFFFFTRLFEWPSMKLKSCKEAHESEVLSVDFLQFKNEKREWLASAGRDRLVHIFDCSEGELNLLQTLDDHSAAITSAKFDPEHLRLISCGADKALFFRSVNLEEQKITRDHSVFSQGTVFDLDINFDKNILVSTTQDKKMNLYSLQTG
jgi:WD40 repeat protein